MSTTWPPTEIEHEMSPPPEFCALSDKMRKPPAGMVRSLVHGSSAPFSCEMLKLASSENVIRAEPTRTP